ncbi:hypothetical protein GE09DRAFT_1062688 [Coniochaeta sp. 2T2.1]|nr:hypothetical protein GE09DRAFT_1062688 [Coniochaeta sp. 2T2.1]
MASTNSLHQSLQPPEKPPVEQAIPLAPTTQSELTTRSRIWQHLTADVKPNYFAEIELLILTFCTGLQDAISFPDFHCFTSNQTGNTVFLALALVMPEARNEMFITSNIGVALGFFLAGGWLTGQLAHVIGPRNRLWLMVCNFLQACLVFAAAALQYTKGVELQGTALTLVTIGLLAFASGSQVVQSRSLQMTEISTAMATAAWVDLLIDPHLFALRNRGRNRRAAFLTTLFVGSLVGALIFRAVGSATAVVVSAAGKLLVSGMFMFNPSEKPKVESAEAAV